LEIADYEFKIRIIKFKMVNYIWKCDQFI